MIMVVGYEPVCLGQQQLRAPVRVPGVRLRRAVHQTCRCARAYFLRFAPYGRRSEGSKHGSAALQLELLQCLSAGRLRARRAAVMWGWSDVVRGSEAFARAGEVVAPARAARIYRSGDQALAPQRAGCGRTGPRPASRSCCLHMPVSKHRESGWPMHRIVLDNSEQRWTNVHVSSAGGACSARDEIHLWGPGGRRLASCPPRAAWARATSTPPAAPWSHGRPTPSAR
jgi:hypothetical protein